MAFPALLQILLDGTWEALLCLGLTTLGSGHSGPEPGLGPWEPPPLSSVTLHRCGPLAVGHPPFEKVGALLRGLSVLGSPLEWRVSLPSILLVGAGCLSPAGQREAPTTSGPAGRLALSFIHSQNIN